jgi:hypothetical protein
MLATLTLTIATALLLPLLSATIALNAHRYDALGTTEAVRNPSTPPPPPHIYTILYIPNIYRIYKVFTYTRKYPRAKQFAPAAIQ